MQGEENYFCRTSSVGSDTGENASGNSFKPLPVIVDILDETHLTDLQNQFAKSTRGRLPKDRLRAILEQYSSDLTYSDEDFDILYFKLNSTEGDGATWELFVDYLLAEYAEKSIAKAGNALLLLAVPIASKPKFLKTYHRHPIIRIAFNAAITKNRTVSFSNGKYLTASHDGVIKSWSLNMRCENSWTTTCPSLKVSSTWITDLVCLPDINKVCTSSTERQLRFYHTAKDNFDLRLVITTLDQPVVCMYYRFFQNIERKSLLLCGDMGGSVKVFEFSSAEGGPFKQRLGENFSLVRYSDVILGSINGLEVWELRGLHKNWVKQVYCYKSAARLASCANHSGASLTIGYGPQDNHRIQFNVDKGISTFDIDEDRHLVATGCANHEVRLWDTEAPGRALAVFTGHMTSIASVLLDSVENRTYSLSRDRVIRVWDNRTKECIQTFCEKLHDLGPPVPMVTLFNPDRRTWMIGAFHMALLKVGNVVDPNYSEGYTHSRPVTKALYNTLFKCLITVGMDSCIMTWQPLTGKRTYIIQNAHTRYVYGEKEAIGITAATYNSSKLFLMTGAMDGTVKMWNFNAGTCLRNMSIEENCCVTDIVWIPGRILAIGWNRHVTEWEDTTKIGNSKDWRSYHKEDILASVFCPPNTIATTSCAGELVFCRLETGQSFKRFNVAVPGVVVTAMSDIKNREKKNEERSHSRRMSSLDYQGNRRPSSRETGKMQKRTSLLPPASKFTAARRRRVTTVNIPVSGFKHTPRCGVHCAFYLATRVVSAQTGTLLLSLENGHVQLWTHHSVGGLIAKFYAVHTVADYVISMNSDQKNEYLFTGHVAGYVKVWLIKDFGNDTWVEEKLCMPLMRLKFPFLLNDRFPGRAKRAIRGQKEPMLLSSFRAHVNAVNHIEYIDSNEIIITSGNDCSVRFWTLGGQYIGTLGGTMEWPRISPNKPARLNKCRIPPDIKRVASSTTLKVLTNAYAPEKKKETETKDQVQFRKMMEKRPVEHEVYGQTLELPLLGNHYSIPRLKQQPREEHKISRADAPYMRILNNMRVHLLEPIIPRRAPAFLQDEKYFEWRRLKAEKEANARLFNRSMSSHSGYWEYF